MRILPRFGSVIEGSSVFGGPGGDGTGKVDTEGPGEPSKALFGGYLFIGIQSSSAIGQ